jgi:type IV pilus assembly protein PilV
MEPHVNSNNAAGFTLIEFCVATLIMMVGLLGLLQAVNLAAQQNLATVIRNEAVSVADEQMVFAKAAESTASTYISVVQGTTITATSTVNRKVRGGNSTFTITRSDSGMSAKSKEVEILVSWTYRSQVQNHRVTSLFSNPQN